MTKKPISGQHLLIVDDHVPWAAIDRRQCEVTVVLWWAPHDFKVRNEVVDLGDLVEYSGAVELATKPLIRWLELDDNNTFPWRRYFVEPLFREGIVKELRKQIKDSLHRRFPSIASVRHIGDENHRQWLNDSFPHYPIASTDYPFVDYSTKYRSPLARVRAFLREDPLNIPYDVLCKIDKNRSLRATSGHLLPTPAVQQGQVCFLSSYSHNTRTLAAFRSSLATPSHWVVINPSARRPIKQGNHYPLYRFSVPSHGSSEAMPPLPDNYNSKSSIGHKEELAVNALVNAWNRYLLLAQPSSIVVANSLGIEGLLARIAASRGIQVVSVPHGIVFGEVYNSPIAKNSNYCCYGEAWQTFHDNRFHEQAIESVPSGLFPKIPMHREKLVFFSWPTSLQFGYNDFEIKKALISSLGEVCSLHDFEGIIKPHPSESPDLLREMVRKLGVGHRLQVDSEATAEEVLSTARVVLMFRSTLLLNCLTNSIPVVMPGWIDTGMNDFLRQIPTVELPLSVESLEETLGRLLSQPTDCPNITPWLNINDRWIDRIIGESNCASAEAFHA